MRALIVGGHGAIGSAVARHADAIGIETHAAVRTAAGAERLQDHPAIVRHYIDIEDPAAVEALLSRVAPQWIVMAAFPAEKAGQRPEARRRLLGGMANGLLGVLEGCAAHRFAGTLTWMGSAAVYGRGTGARSTSDPLQPHTWRGAVKAAESMLASQFASAHDLRLVELRVFTAFGQFEQRQRLIPALLRAALGGTTVRVAATPGSRDWTHFEDIARGCVASLGALGGIFNLCTGTLTDTRTVAAILETIAGVSLVAPEPWSGEDHYGAVGFGMPAEPGSGFDWSPTVTLADGLQRAWEWAQTSQGRDWLFGAAP